MPDAEGTAAAAGARLRRLVDGGGESLVVYDLEVTSWEGALARRWSGPGEFPEIIQIGAVKLSRDAGWAETESFNPLVRPVRNPVLSDYIIALTGITQSAVDTQGLPFAEALARFARLVGDGKALSNGGDDEMVAENCALHKMVCPIPSPNLVNISRDLSAALGQAGHIVSSTLPAVMGVANSGRAHDGLADARAIAAALRRVLLG